MDDLCNEVDNHGFIISNLHCKKEILLKSKDYSDLTECENIEDICAKLQNKYPTLRYLKNYNKSELKQKLYEDLLEDFKAASKHPSLKIVTDFIREQYQIDAFFYLLSCKDHDPELINSFENIDPVSYFIALDTLKFSANMEEVYGFCVTNSFLKEYYEKCTFNLNFRDNDFSYLHLIFNKLHLKKYFAMSDSFLENTKFFNLLKYEGDKYNVNLLLSLLETDLKESSEICAEITTFPFSVTEKLIAAKSVEEIKTALSKIDIYAKLFSDSTIDIDIALKKIELAMYISCFYYFNDISVCYAYLKLKEHEISNILFMTDAILSKRRSLFEKIIVPE